MAALRPSPTSSYAGNRPLSSQPGDRSWGCWSQALFDFLVSRQYEPVAPTAAKRPEQSLSSNDSCLATRGIHSRERETPDHATFHLQPGFRLGLRLAGMTKEEFY